MLYLAINLQGKKFVKLKQKTNVLANCLQYVFSCICFFLFNGQPNHTTPDFAIMR